jgi:hypothetical protein
MQAAFPIGTLYFNTGGNPSLTLRIGRWSLMGKGEIKIGNSHVDVFCWQRTR